MMLRVNDEGRYSLTRPVDARAIATEIVAAARKHRVYISEIVDATAGMGGDALTFLRYFRRVTAVEMKDDNFKLLQENTREQCGPIDQSRIRLLHDDYTKCFARFSAPIVYFDPPWGGPEYKTKASVSLSLSGMDISEVVRQTLRITIRGHHRRRLVAVKVPNNFALAEFKDSLGWCYNVRCVSVRDKFKLLIVTR